YARPMTTVQIPPTFEFTEVLGQSGVSALLGYFCARSFTSINPWQAGLFGALSSLISRFVDPLFDKAFQKLDLQNDHLKTTSKFFTRILSIGASVVTASTAMGVLGLPVPLGGAVLLAVGIVALRIILLLGLELVIACLS